MLARRDYYLGTLVPIIPPWTHPPEEKLSRSHNPHSSCSMQNLDKTILAFPSLLEPARSFMSYLES